MNKPPDFWMNVARDVSTATHAMNDQVPLFDDMDQKSQETLALVCQIAVKAAAKRGRFLLESPVVPDDYTPGAA